MDNLFELPSAQLRKRFVKAGTYNESQHRRDAHGRWADVAGTAGRVLGTAAAIGIPAAAIGIPVAAALATRRGARLFGPAQAGHRIRQGHAAAPSATPAAKPWPHNYPFVRG